MNNFSKLMEIRVLMTYHDEQICPYCYEKMRTWHIMSYKDDILDKKYYCNKCEKQITNLDYINKIKEFL